jgi:cell division protein FtsB
MMTLPKKILLAAVIFFFLVLLISSFFGKKGLVEINQARKKYQALIQEIERLEKEKIKSESWRRIPRP